MTAQKGPLWWAAHHRIHHKLSDQPGDLHSVIQSGFWWSHMGWILARDLEDTDYSPDQGLREVSRSCAGSTGTGWCRRSRSASLTFLIGGFFALVWGFAVAQVLCWHGTFTINSLSHLWGARRYETDDDSRNNPVLAVITHGRGLAQQPSPLPGVARARASSGGRSTSRTTCCARSSSVGLVWDLHGVPDHVRDDGHGAEPAAEPAAELASEPDVYPTWREPCSSRRPTSSCGARSSC